MWGWFSKRGSTGTRLSPRDGFGRRQVVFDCETDGLDPQKNRILSLGAVEIVDRKIQLESSFEWRLKRSSFDGGGAEIHEFTGRDLISGLEEEEAVKRFVDFVGTDLLVGHFIDFDVALIQESLKRSSMPLLENKTYDTLEVARRKFPDGVERGQKSWALSKVCQKLGLEHHGAHTALGDAYMTAELFLYLTSE
ncbi:3'-5' exonuclease [Cryomorphaceae bacterium]|nr:3'-5' exonuclease [Cryomorphaceae bacterium]